MLRDLIVTAIAFWFILVGGLFVRPLIHGVVGEMFMFMLVPVAGLFIPLTLVIIYMIFKRV